MIKTKQIELAGQLQGLHKTDEMFVLPNAWNAGSAYVFEKEGFDAVGTTSAGVAYALGYPDGEDLTIEDLAIVVRQITNRISIPLSVDFERGYSEDLSELKSNICLLLECGAVGFNIEDGRSDGSLDGIEYMQAKIRALVEVKETSGIDFVINARTCTYWLNVADDDLKLAIAIERGNAYRDSGADCIFIPGMMDKNTVNQLVKNIEAPLNIILNPIYNDLYALKELGVKRLSLGSGPVRSIYSHLIDMTKELKEGKFTPIFENSFSYGKANAYFTK